MLSPVYPTMDKDRFEFLPESTNAVEAYNRLSKTGKVPRPLSVVLISLYKKDMVAILQYLAETEGMATTYDDRTPAARKKRAVKANAARRKRRCHVEDDALGPPDRNSDFHPSKKRKTTKKVSKVVEYVVVYKPFPFPSVYKSFPLVDIMIMENFSLAEAEDSTVYQVLHNPLTTC